MYDILVFYGLLTVICFGIYRVSRWHREAIEKMDDDGESYPLPTVHSESSVGR